MREKGHFFVPQKSLFFKPKTQKGNLLRKRLNFKRQKRSVDFATHLKKSDPTDK